MSARRAALLTAVAILGAACGGNGSESAESPPPPTTSSTFTSTTTTTTATTSTVTEPPPSTDPADLVLYGGPIITVSPNGTLAEAVAVDDGRFVVVGSREEAMAVVGADTRVVDLGGLTVMPGVVDPHVHYIQNQTPELGAMVEDQRLLLENGRTTVGIPAIIPFNMEGFDAMDEADLEILRMHFYVSYNEVCGDLVGDFWREVEFDRSAERRMTFAGVKLFTDGGACNSPAVSWEYPDTAEAAALGVVPGSGDLYVSADEVASVVAETDARGGLTLIHAIGDVAVEVALDGVELGLDGRDNTNRHRIDHNVIVPPELHRRYGELGITPVVFGNFSSCREASGQGWSAIQPAELLPWHRTTVELMAANPGLPVAFHSDVPHGWLGMFEQLWGLVTLAEVDHENGEICPAPSWLEDHGVPVETALEMMTINAAYAMDLEADIGSIEVGKLADMVLIAHDPLSQTGDELLDNAVIATLIDGLVVHCDPEALALCDQIGDSPLGGDAEAVSYEEPPPAEGAAVPIVVVEASAAVPDFPVEGVHDGIVDLGGWVAGDFAPQWIELDLGGIIDIAEIHLWVDQSPDGPTEHRILGGPEPAPTEELARFSGDTHWGQLLEIEIGRRARYVRIETISSPSWVGWIEIAVIGHG